MHGPKSPGPGPTWQTLAAIKCPIQYAICTTISNAYSSTYWFETMNIISLEKLHFTSLRASTNTNKKQKEKTQKHKNNKKPHQC